MGRHTGRHYNNVAAQMHAYLNNPGYQYPHYGYDYYGGGYGGGYDLGYGGGASLFQYGAQQIGVDPMLVTDVGRFARSFMYNLLA
ncbi:unnamed protein product [Rotaria sp. Silwood2]|nr:unnamed protein product [Rotaria sp. Silwood2]CAF3107113.1 unnamed protein product [Rotaria sp. Silwood2]CAF3188343.1 unnamed protein product [Rotaria sp. Silwood2]CAF3389720.1 unnamed protein product [Rotaria sp. Silwood2]CAF4012959.1 unnamed protein product [Rotaria sp. Silwood2]